jgi:hypothetical protein
MPGRFGHHFEAARAERAFAAPAMTARFAVLV